ncbi:MAG: AMP-binding protein, partial [Pseudomonadota bacterium]
VKANYVPLDPVVFLRRSAQIYPNKTAIIHGKRTYSYKQFYQRSCKLANALKKIGIKYGDCVSIMAPNIPEMLEAHNAIPMLGAVLNSLNIRLDPNNIAFMLDHSGAKVILCDREFNQTIKAALSLMDEQKPKPEIIDIYDCEGPSIELNDDCYHYEELLNDSSSQDPQIDFDDEWRALSLLYTSGTTGNPKGCVYHARGAYLNAIGNMIAIGLNWQSKYLWTLPMFHCDGWTFTWGVSAACATHICLRNVNAKNVFEQTATHQATHMCGAPVVLNMIANADKRDVRHFEHTVLCATGGAAPPSSVISAMEMQGFNIVHLYGLTESYGPAMICCPQEEWNDLPQEQRARKTARQGVNYLTLEKACVMDPKTMKPVPHDGQTIGEIMLRGNTIMKGYLKNPEANHAAFKDGWFHSGDLAVTHEDGYIEVKDRSKDIIISGGENISSLEIEEVLYRHPAILEAAIVAKPDPKWGEIPCAFVQLRQNKQATLEDLQAYCRQYLAGYKLPRRVIFGPLPKTSTGKIQKFQLRQQAKKLD